MLFSLVGKKFGEEGAFGVFRVFLQGGFRKAFRRGSFGRESNALNSRIGVTRLPILAYRKVFILREVGLFRGREEEVVIIDWYEALEVLTVSRRELEVEGMLISCEPGALTY